MLLDGEGSFYVLTKEMVIAALERWEESTNQRPNRVELDFDEPHYIAISGLTPIAYTQISGTAFVMVSKESKHIKKAVEEYFGTQNDIKYTKTQTLQSIAESALKNCMGIAMCDCGGVTFIEPKNLSRSMQDGF